MLHEVRTGPSDPLSRGAPRAVQGNLTCRRGKTRSDTNEIHHAPRLLILPVRCQDPPRESKSRLECPRSNRLIWIVNWVRRHAIALAVVGVAILGWWGAFQWLLQRSLHPQRSWDPEIAAYATADATNPPPAHSVLFFGSSSIRLWDSLRRDFPRFHVFRRGLNSARIEDLCRHVDDLVLPYDPEMIIFYCGDNDLADGTPPAAVVERYRGPVEQIKESMPDVRIGLLSIKPSPLRSHLIKPIRRTNRLLEEWCAQDDQLEFIDVCTPMLDPLGRPRQEFFKDDGLHPSPLGYSTWAQIVRPHLPSAALKSPPVSPSPGLTASPHP